MINDERLVVIAAHGRESIFPVTPVDCSAMAKELLALRKASLTPSKLTAENGAKAALMGEFKEKYSISCPECFGDDDCETCDGSGRIHVEVPVSWTTIKEIWAKGIDHFQAAAPEAK